MTKSGSALLAVFLLAGAGCAAGGRDTGRVHGMTGAGDGMNHHGMMMKKMDANADGVITKDEFMRTHEMMFDHMKNTDGVIDLKAMHKGGGHMGGGRGRAPMGAPPR